MRFRKEQLAVRSAPRPTKPAKPQVPSDAREVAHAQPALAALVRRETMGFASATTTLSLQLTQLAWSSLGSHADPKRRVGAVRVRQVFDQIAATLYNLDDAEPAMVERALSAVSPAHAGLMQSLEELLLNHRYDGKPLSDLELGVLYVLARTAIEVSHLAKTDALALPKRSHLSWLQ